MIKEEKKNFNLKLKSEKIKKRFLKKKKKKKKRKKK